MKIQAKSVISKAVSMGWGGQGEKGEGRGNLENPKVILATVQTKLEGLSTKIVLKETSSFGLCLWAN